MTFRFPLPPQISRVKDELITALPRLIWGERVG